VSDYTIVKLEDVDDAFGGQYPGVMRFLTSALGNEQVAITHRQMPPGAGGKGGYGHRHKIQEEIYFVVSGTLQFKLDDEVVDVSGGSAVRVAPATARSVYNEGPEDAELLIISTIIDDVREDVEMVEDFWPAD
jgi:mannose-6-phosphate isomerase-like protein (cupin superfamily)